ncbi:MAG: restriction endonuclease [Chloroflexi bacterium]|nr:restriction endonuclease [Chloroflexota bacterium]
MTLPRRKELELAILEELAKVGGRARPVELYQRVAARFNLAPEDEAWRRNRQWAQQDLSQKGELDSTEGGVWAITEKGLAKLGKPKAVSRPAAMAEPSPAWAPAGLADLADSQERTVRERLLERIKAVSPAEFERLVARVLEALGFSRVWVTGLSGDGGLDGECYLAQLDLKAAFQAKRFASHNVGGPLMAEFRGHIQGKYERGIYITTTDFSPGAVEIAESGGGVRILLVNGARLLEIMMEHGLGVTSEPLFVRRLDEPFFQGLSAG